MQLKYWLDEQGILSKGRLDGEGKRSAGVPFSRGALYRILRNPIYVGDISHKGTVYPGNQDAMLDRNLWEQVQARLTENRQGKPRSLRATSPSLLTGILFDQSGNLYTPTHSNKAGRRYR